MNIFEQESRKLSPESRRIDALHENQLFNLLAIPITSSSFPEIHDAEFYVRHDGLIVNAEGWHHPHGQLIGEVIYAPDITGSKEIFGQKYRKMTLFPETYTPVPYNQRGKLLGQYDSTLDQTTSNPYFARYKQIFPQEAFGAYLPAQSVFKKIVDTFPEAKESLHADLENAQAILGIDLRSVSMGFTGAPLLGNVTNIHDLDLVFQGDLDENMKIAKAIRALVATNTQRRVIEGGKGWNIRFYNDRETLICSFYSYRNPQEAPLRNFTMKVVAEDIQVEGIVSDDKHTLYTPTVLTLEESRVIAIGQEIKNMNFSEPLHLIAYHTATRGECFEGDTVRATGALVDIETPTDHYLAVCVIEREGIRNLTPTWSNFYED